MEIKGESKDHSDFFPTFPNKIASSLLKLLPKNEATNSNASNASNNSTVNTVTTNTTTSPTNVELFQRFLPKMPQMPRMYSTLHGFTMKKKRFLSKKVGASTLIRTNSLKSGHASIKIFPSGDTVQKKRKKNVAQKPKNLKFDVAWDMLTRNVVSSICIKYRDELTCEKLQESFKGADKLKKVEISNCTLMDETLPDTLFKNCKEVRLLIIRKNNLKSLERNLFQQMKYLDSLNLSMNQISLLDETLFKNCVRLSHLDLSNNQLEDLAENVFDSCENLQSLNLSNNKIENLRDNIFRELKKLKYIDLANNKLISLKAIYFQECIELRKIDLEGNLMKSLNEDFINELVSQRKKIEKSTFAFVIPNSKLLLIFRLSPKSTAIEHDKRQPNQFFHWAFKIKEFEIIRFCIIEARNSNLKRVDLVSFLSQKDSNGQSVMHLAVQYGNVEIIKHLLDSNIDLNQTDAQNDTILHLLVIHKKMSALQCLLEHLGKTKKLANIDLNAWNNEGKTALHLASTKGLVAAIHLLNEYGCNVNVLDKYKLTPLEAVIMSSECDQSIKKKSIEALIKCGASYKPFQKELHSYLVDLNVKHDEITNLVFEGGGIKGVAYVGALKNAQNKLFNHENIISIGGTSAGAMTACLLALNYSLQEMEDILKQLDLKNIFLDDENFKNEFLDIKENFHSNLLLNTFRVGKFLKQISEKFGLFPGETFLNFFEEKIARQLGKHATFRDLQEKIESGDKRFKFLYLIGSNLTTGDSETFSHIDTPDMIISDAVRISMSIPLIWPPHKYYIRDENNERIVRPDKSNDFYVDGGLLNNYPIGIFDRKIITNASDTTFFNYKTLGFRLSKPYKFKSFKKNGEQEDLFFPYLTSLINFYFKKEEVNHVKREQDQQRTVYIDTLGLSALDFNLSIEAMDFLIESGFRAVDEFLEINNNDNNER